MASKISNRASGATPDTRPADSARNLRRARAGLLASTALVAASLAASGAMAQTFTAGPGTIVTQGGTTTNDTGAGGGFQNTGTAFVEVNNAVVNNTNGTPTAAAILTVSNGFNGFGDGVTFNGTNTLTAAPSGAGYSLSSQGGNNTFIRLPGTLNATGQDGFVVSTSGSLFYEGAGDFNLMAQTPGSGTGLLWNALGGSICCGGEVNNVLSGAINASNFDTAIALSATGSVEFNHTGGGAITGARNGVTAQAGSGDIDLAIGSSISATNVGIDASTGGPGSVSVTAAAAITAGQTGIISNTSGGANAVTTLAGGTINGGAFGVVAAGATGANATTVTVGGAIGANQRPGAAIVATGAGVAGDVISINANVLGNSTGLRTNSAFTTNIAAGTTLGAFTFALELAAGGGTVNNAGTVSGFYGVLSNTLSRFRLDNSGTITVSGTGVSTGSTDAIITNSGVISTTSGGDGIFSYNSGTVINTGTISGGSGRFGVLLGGNGVKSVVNGGTISNVNTAADSNAIYIGTSGTTTVTNQNGGAITSAGGYGVRLDGIATLNNDAGATIRYTGSRNRAGAAVLLGGAATLNNLGSIDMTGASGQGVIVNGGATINNGSAADATALIRSTPGSAVLITGNTASTTNNYGRIEGGNGIVHVDGGTGAVTVNNLGAASIVYGSSFSGILGGSGGVTVQNAGLIASNGSGGGTAIVSSGAATITNSGTIGTGAVDGAGAFTIGGSGSAISTAGNATITNSGTIYGNSSAATTNASNSVLTVTNIGSISSGTAGDALRSSGTVSVLNAGMISTSVFSAVNGLSGGSVVNAAAGTLMGGNNASLGEAVQFGNGAASFTNYGMATSTTGRAVFVTGSAATTINLHAGSNTGSILTGSGDDVVALFNGRGSASAATVDAVSGITLQNAGTLAGAMVGAVDLGGGVDTLMLRGVGDGTAANGAAGSFSIGTSTGAEILTKADAGTWTLTGAAVTPGITINAGTGGAPGSGGLLVFNGTTGLTGAINVNGATIRAATAGAFGAGTITTIDPTIQYGATGVYANPIVLASVDPVGDPTRIQADAGVNATLTGLISQSGGAAQPLVFDGAGTITLTNGANDYAGLTTISNGTVVQSNTASALGSGGVLVNSGAVLQFDNQTGNALFLERGTYSGAGTLRFTGNAGASTAFGFQGNNVTIGLASGGLIDVVSGTLVGSTNVQGFWTNNLGDLAIASGATFDGVEGLIRVDGLTGSGTLRGGFFGSGSITIGVDNGSATFDGVITDGIGANSVLNLIKVGTGTQTLTGANSFTGDILINAGALSVSSSVNLGDVGRIGLLGGTLATTGDFTTNRTVFTSSLNGLAGVNVAGGTTFSVAGALSGDGALNKTGLGTLNLLAANTGFSGDLFVNGGSIRAGNSEAFGTGTIHLVDPTLIYGATGFYANNILLEVQSPATADPSTLRAEAGVAAFITGSITQGSGMGVDPFQPLVIDGPGAIILTNTANAWAGTTTVTAGSRLQGMTQTISGNNLLVNGDVTYLQSTSGTLTANASGTGRIFVQGLGAGQVFTVASALNMTNFGLLVSDNSTLSVTGAIRSTNGTALNLNNSSTVAGIVTNSGTISGVTGISGAGPADVTNLSGGIISSTTGNTVRFGLQNASVVNAGSISGASIFAGVFFGGTGSVTNQAGGAITNTGTVVQFGGASGTLDNSGTISNRNTNSAVYFNGTGTVINRASGTVSSDLGFGVQFAGAGAAVTNLGVISAGQRGVSLDGPNSTLTNSGQISGGAHAFVSLNGTSTVTNQVGGVMTGTRLNAVLTRGAGSVITNAGLMNGGNAAVYTEGANTSLTNTGVIRVTGSNAPTVISGVYMQGAGSSVTNSGAIESTLANGRGVFLAGDAGVITNQSGGVISGNGSGAAIVLTGAGYALDLQAGSTVNGLIDASNSSGRNVVGIAGALNGSYAGGTGADDVTLYSGMALTGVVDGGAGTDAFVLAGGGDATFDAARAVNFESRAMNGTGTWTLTGADASTAAWNVNSGTLAASGGSSINDAAGVSVATGATLALLNDETIGSLAGSGLVNLGANRLTLADAQTTTYAGVISGSGGLTAGAANTLTLAGANTYTGTTIAEGGLILGASGVLADASDLAIASTGVVDLQAFDETVNSAIINGTLNGTGTLTASTYGLNGATVNANLGGGDLFNTGSVSTLNGTSGSANVVVQAGTLSLGASDRLADNATVLVATGSTLDLNAFNDTVGLALLNGTLAGTGTLTAGQYQLNGATVNANLGAGDLFNTGGVSNLNGTSGSANVVVQAGTLSLGASDRLADNATLSIATGSTLDLNAFDDTVGLALLNGALAGAGTLTAGQYQLNGATVNANLGAGDLFNTGGVSTLNGTSAADIVFVQAGTLGLGASDRLADNATVSVAAGSVLNLNAFNDTVGLAIINGTLDGTGTLTAAQYQLNAATMNANLGDGALFNLGGVTTLNGTAAAQQVQLNAGTLQLGANERLSDAATVSVSSGATLDVNGFSERFAALFGTGDVNVGAGRVTFGGPESAFGGRLSGTGSLVHTGGLFTLVGDHTIGSISNTGGELRFLGSTSGRIAVSGGSLTGAGTIGGALTASNGGVISPGLAGIQDGIGGFTAGSLTMSGGTLAIDVLGRSGGNLIDQLRINGTANLTGGLLNPTFQGSTATEFDFSTRYLFLQANNLVGTFANGGTFTAAGPENLFWRVRYDLAPNAAVLELRELINFDPGVIGTGNQRAVGGALSGGQLGASDDWAAILSLVAGLSDSERTAAFDSISGEPLASVTTSLFSANDRFLNALRQGGITGRDRGGEALNFVDRLSFAGGRDNSADRLGDVLGAFDPSAPTGRGAGGWVSAYAGDQTLDGKAGQATVETSLNGFAGGYGVRNGAVSLGGAGGVTRLEGDVPARQGHYESDLSHAAAYVAFDDGVWAADMTASFYGGDLETRRGITIGAFRGQAIGNSHVEGQALSASVARRFQVTDNTMIALGAIGTASNASVDGYTETGAGGLSLEVAGMERDWQSLQISARGTQDYRVNGQRIRLHAGAGVMATAGDRQATGEMRFSGAPIGFGAFNVEGAETPPLAGLADVGIEVGVREGVSVSAGYRGLFSERLQDNQFGVKLNVSW